MQAPHSRRRRRLGTITAPSPRRGAELAGHAVCGSIRAVLPSTGRRRVGRASARSRTSCCLAAVGSQRPSCSAAIVGAAARRVLRRRTSSTTHEPPASTTATTVSSSTSWAAASPRSTATTTGVTSCSSPAGPSPRRCTTTTARSAGPCASRRSPSPVTDLTAVTGAYPIDIDSDGHIDLVVLRRGGDVVLRGLGGCRFEDADRRARARRAARLDDRVQRDVGGHERACRRWRSAATSCRARTECDKSWLVRPDASGDALRRADRAHPGLLHAVDAVQRLEPLRASATCACRTTGTTTSTARSSCGASPPGAAAHAVHRGRRLAAAADLGHGHRQPGPHRRRAARGVPHEPGATTSCRRSPTARPVPTTADIALDARRHRAAAVRRRRRAAVDGVAPGVRRRQQRRLRRPVRHQGQRRGADRPGEHAIRATCSSGEPDGSFVEGAEEAGIVDYERARGAAVVDLNLDGLLDLVVVHRRANVDAVAQRRSRRRRAARGRWATGSTCGCSSRRRTSTPSARGSRCGPATARATREVTVGGGHVSGELGWLHTGLGSAERGRGARALARRHGRAVDDGARRLAGDDRARRDPRRRPGHRRADDMRRRHVPPRLADDRAARLRDARRRAAACRRPLRRAAATAARRRWTSAATTTSSCGRDREHSANLAYLSGFDPRFEEALLVVGPDRRSGGARRATSARAWPRPHRCPCGR